MLCRSSGNHDWLLTNASACVCCSFRLRNAGECVWMETGLETELICGCKGEWQVLPRCSALSADASCHQVFIFQQDSAPANHRARETIQLLLRKTSTSSLLSQTARTWTQSTRFEASWGSRDQHGRTQTATDWCLERTAAEHWWRCSRCYQRVEKASASLCSCAAATFRTFNIDCTLQSEKLLFLVDYKCAVWCLTIQMKQQNNKQMGIFLIFFVSTGSVGTQFRWRGNWNDLLEVKISQEYFYQKLFDHYLTVDQDTADEKRAVFLTHNMYIDTLYRWPSTREDACFHRRALGSCCTAGLHVKWQC